MTNTATNPEAIRNRNSGHRPHSNTAGYVTERRSHHPRLPGHFVIIDRKNGGDWIDADDRWVVIHINGDACGCMVSLTSLPAARDIMRAMAAGGDDVDLGQHDEVAR